MSPEEHQIDDAIEAASNPPETVEPVKPADDSERTRGPEVRNP